VTSNQRLQIKLVSWIAEAYIQYHDITRMPSSLRPITRECMHLVMRGYCRSRDKDGGHTI